MDNPSAHEPEQEHKPQPDQDETIPPAAAYPVADPPPSDPEQSSLAPEEDSPSFDWEMASPEATYLEPDQPHEPEQPPELQEAEPEPDSYSPEAVHTAPDAALPGLSTEMNEQVGGYSPQQPGPEAPYSAPPPAPALEDKNRPILPSGYTGAAPGSSSYPRRDKSVALILEILPGLIGFLGFGWIYAGKTQTGVMWLVGFLAWNLIALLLDITICFIPIHITVSLACLIISPVSLNNYLNRNPQVLGGA
jgi:hypothetical protein